MINFGINLASLVGLFYLILGIAYPIFTLILLAQRSNELNDTAKIFYIIQALVSPIALLLSGLILLFQGWRLDPILAVSQFLVMGLIVFLAIKDIAIGWRAPNR